MKDKSVTKWCTECKKDTHNTKDCWGLGTVAVPRLSYNAPPMFFTRVMTFIRMNDAAIQTHDAPFCRITP